MIEAEQVAAFTAIKHGLDVAIAQAKIELLRVAAEQGIKSFTTPWGSVTVGQSEDDWHVKLDEAAFLAWVQEHAPEQVETITAEPVTRVKAMYRAQFMTGLVRVGQQVIDQDSGEVVEFAAAQHMPAGEPYITYPATKQQKTAKAIAEAWVADAASALTEGMRDRLAIEAES